MRVAQVEREVERADHADDAERLVAQRLARRDRAGLAGRSPSPASTRSKRLTSVWISGLGLAAQLAGLEDDRVGERVGARGELAP